MLDQKNLISIARNNVEIVDLKNNIIVKSDLIEFDNNKGIIKSSIHSEIIDSDQNILTADNVIYDLKNHIIKLDNTFLKDKNENIFNIEIAFLDVLKKELIGKDITLNLNNKTFNTQNDPRIKGRSIIYKDRFTEITNGIFTTCKKTEKCPPWQLSAKKINLVPKKFLIN